MGAAVALVVLAVGSAGCGGDPAMSGRAADRLHTQVAAVEYAIAGGDFSAARDGLNEIRATTVRMADRGEVDAARAAEIVDAVEEADLELVRLEERGGG